MHKSSFISKSYIIWTAKITNTISERELQSCDVFSRHLLFIYMPNSVFYWQNNMKTNLDT